MAGDWITWALVVFGVLVAIVGVIAYIRMVSPTSSERPFPKSPGKEKRE
ncbi:hypothetical protein [Paenibacillus sp. SYP-B4298]|nr:hypothetical protein [Paenibacillus sp. SYP-B4298]